MSSLNTAQGSVEVLTHATLLGLLDGVIPAMAVALHKLVLKVCPSSVEAHLKHLNVVVGAGDNCHVVQVICFFVDADWLHLSKALEAYLISVRSPD